jgi:hypothetical protein
MKPAPPVTTTRFPVNGIGRSYPSAVLALPVAVALAVLAAAGCGGDGDEGAAEREPRTQLEIEVTGGGTERRWTLTCDPEGGSHPDPAAACEAVHAQHGALEPLPDDVACTQEYGGPQTAVVSGTIDGEPYRGTFNRRNGCEIGRWERLQPLLVVRGGA